MKYFIWVLPVIFILISRFLFSCQDVNKISEPGESISIENDAYRLTFSFSDSSLISTLDDKKSNTRIAEGVFLYKYGNVPYTDLLILSQLEEPAVFLRKDKLTVLGKLNGLDMRHEFFLPEDGDIMEERISFKNNSDNIIALPELEAGFTRKISSSAGLDSTLLYDRWIAIPLKERPDDPYEFVHDFSLDDMIARPGSEPHPNHRQWINPAPSRHRWSEAWAWIHGDYTLGIYSFCQENMLFSVLSKLDCGDDIYLRFGGACEIMDEPSALLNIEPGESVDLGMQRYQTKKSGYLSAAYTYREILDKAGCRFPDDYNPPVHWNQIFDMDGAWDNRQESYTRKEIMAEAKKAAIYSCDALYLDPGWDTEFASFIWAEDRLGTRKEFIKEIKTEYGLDLALHCPLGTWMSTGYPMGPSAVSKYPPESYRTDTPEMQKRKKVPFEREGRRNLALLPEAVPRASSVRENYVLQKYTIKHINNGWYGDSNSWIAKEMPAWIAIDLADIYTISKVCLGNDHTMSTLRNAVSEFKVQVTTLSGTANIDDWETVASYRGEPLNDEKTLDFAPVDARQVRIILEKSSSGSARLDEIEIYEDKSLSENELLDYESYALYEDHAYPSSPPLVCMGSQQYMNVAGQRLLDICSDGVVFLMFDGNWWNGGCSDENHGHPVPYRFEDHIRANIEMTRRIHEEYPEVLIEMHDMILGGSFGRVTPVYYKYGLPGSYDENWGFELMWDPLASIMEDKAILMDPTYKPGKALPLYYYNLGCNVPIYLHIDLSSDNINCLSFWWYASTCRHLGIGGTHRDPDVVKAQIEAMKKYKHLERFFKRGEFYGLSEEIHIHVLPDEKAFVVNVFNLTDRSRTVKGSVQIPELGIVSEGSCTGSADWCKCVDGTFMVEAELTPWSVKVAKFEIR